MGDELHAPTRAESAVQLRRRERFEDFKLLHRRPGVNKSENILIKEAYEVQSTLVVAFFYRRRGVFLLRVFFLLLRFLGVVKLSVYINVYQNERIHLKSIFASLFLPLKKKTSSSWAIRCARPVVSVFPPPLGVVAFFGSSSSSSSSLPGTPFSRRRLGSIVRFCRAPREEGPSAFRFARTSLALCALFFSLFSRWIWRENRASVSVSLSPSRSRPIESTRAV